MYVYIHTHRTIYIRTLHYIILQYSTVHYIIYIQTIIPVLYQWFAKRTGWWNPRTFIFPLPFQRMWWSLIRTRCWFQVLIRSISTKVCEKYQETPQDCVFSLKSPANIPGWQDVGGIVPKQIINDDIIGNSLSGCICVSPRVSVQPFMSRLSVAVSPINTSPWWTSKLIVIDMIPQIDPGRMSIMAYRIWIIMVNIKILDNYASNGHISVLYQ